MAYIYTVEFFIFFRKKLKCLFSKCCLLDVNNNATLDPISGEAEREYWSLLPGNQYRHRDGEGNQGRGGKIQ